MLLIVAGPSGEDEHDGGREHPERRDRITSVMQGVDDLQLGGDAIYLPATPARREELLRVHSDAYLVALERFCAAGGGDLDEDTFARADSYDAALKAAGASLAAIEALEERGEGVAFVPVRPPGHHAGVARAMGFCLLNNVAIAAAALVARGQRVLVVDWDVHHGNGTQDIFWDEPNVLYVSTHQSPLYPGTGAADEVGGAHALGLTVNVPLPSGATGDVVHEAIERLAGPTIDRFGPDWVLVSCGFDAHREDPIGGLALSSGDFAKLARLVQTFAPRTGRLALFLEGGYSAQALRSSVTSTIGALCGASVDVEAGTSGGPGDAAIDTAARERRLAMDDAASRGQDAAGS